MSAVSSGAGVKVEGVGIVGGGFISGGVFVCVDWSLGVAGGCRRGLDED